MTHPLDEAHEMYGAEPNEDLSLRNKEERCSWCGVPMYKAGGVHVVRRRRFKTRYCADCYRVTRGFMGWT